MEVVTQFYKRDLFTSAAAPPVSFYCREIAVTWLPSPAIMWLTGRTEAWLTAEQQMIRPWLRFSPLRFHCTVIPGWCDSHSKSADADVRALWDTLQKHSLLFYDFSLLLNSSLLSFEFGVKNNPKFIYMRNNESPLWTYFMCQLFHMLYRAEKWNGGKKESLFSCDHKCWQT